MKRLKYPVGVWYNSEDQKFYAFPIGATDPWGGEVVPLIDYVTWEFKGVFPAGIEVKNVTTDTGDRVTCEFAGKKVYTGNWAIA
jgi:hypothetical protein